MNDVHIRHRIVGKGPKSIGELVKLHRLRRLGNVLRLPNERLPGHSIFPGVGAGWM